MKFGERASQLSGHAARILGWMPDDFWKATPVELGAAFGDGEAIEPVAVEELGALMARFPDERD